ncbi:Dabb family protein [Methylocystis iwaonis]|uniref:Dabb family protein n=1 Tax=Methylocystis iwaonis TaxID=2885079 RepID=UPI002E7C5644|nr:Dabb family protein [Methylocystis iwaonis]
MAPNQSSGSRVTHVILVSFYSHVSQAVREETLFNFRRLGDDCGGLGAGILFWRADWNLDQRKNYHLIAVSVFENEDALRSYVAHPKHKGFASDLSKIADWVVGDIAVGLPVVDR